MRRKNAKRKKTFFFSHSFSISLEFIPLGREREQCSFLPISEGKQERSFAAAASHAAAAHAAAAADPKFMVCSCSAERYFCQIIEKKKERKKE